MANDPVDRIIELYDEKTFGNDNYPYDRILKRLLTYSRKYLSFDIHNPNEFKDQFVTWNVTESDDLDMAIYEAIKHSVFYKDIITQVIKEFMP